MANKTPRQKASDFLDSDEGSKLSVAYMDLVELIYKAKVSKESRDEISKHFAELLTNNIK